MTLSTHVLDAATGRPAAGVGVRLESIGSEARTADATTDADGRIRELGDPGIGVHRITFATGPYFAAQGVATFYPEITVVFEITDAAAHHHVPLLLSPYAYSTYRGS
jgi:5-hydroxyisourate hydrolase